MNRGSEQVQAKLARARKASMRPRFMNRGSDAESVLLNPSSAASMRPRFMNRGSGLKVSRLCLQTSLQ